MFFLSLSVGKGEAQTSDEQIELSRAAAIEMAIRKNIDLRVEALSAAMAETDAARSRALYDPILSASANRVEASFPGETFGTKSTTGTLGVTQYLPTGGSVVASTQTGYTTAESLSPGVDAKDWQSSVGISLLQPILKSAGKESMELGITLADTAQEDAVERFRFFLSDTVFSVITGYNRLYALRQTLQTREAAMASVVALRAELADKKKPSSAQKLELANADYAISQRRRDLVDAGRNVRDQEARLRYLIGMVEPVTLVPVDPPSREEPLETQDEALRLALDHRPDLKQLFLTQKASELQERVARNQLLPDLSLTASTGLSGIAEDSGDSWDQIGSGKGGFWSAGLNFNFPLGNTGAKNDYRQRQLRLSQVKNQVASYSWQIRNAVESDLRALISARLQIQTAEQSQRLATERLEEYRNSRRAGTSSVQDLLNAENDLMFANNVLTDAQEFFAYSVALLWRDMGVLLERQNIHLDISRPSRLISEEVPTLPAIGDAPAAAAPVSTPALETSPLPAAMAVELSGSTSPAPTLPDQALPSQAAAVAADAGPGGYILLLGEYSSEAAAARGAKLVQKAGLKPQVKPGPARQQEMIRLLVGSFAEPAQARQELKRLRQAGADPFLLQGENHDYRVFAGSYGSRQGAEVERQRLQQQGIVTSLEPVMVPSPTFLLSAGPFSDQAAADREAKRLRQQGLDPRIVANGA